MTGNFPHFHSHIVLLKGILFLGCLFLVIIGCKDDKQAQIAQKVQERVEEFKQKKKNECRLRLRDQAEKMVDSILLAEAKQALQDSLSKLRPFRPTQPPEVLPIDTSRVAPLFRSSTGGN
ncbi:MAG: hypothetical protein JNJ57_14860 [Saprospiraceae bacterium]|nr:hypothetical protein [Saprospiraceae bacterium]